MKKLVPLAMAVSLMLGTAQLQSLTVLAAETPAAVTGASAAKPTEPAKPAAKPAATTKPVAKPAATPAPAAKPAAEKPVVPISATITTPGATTYKVVAGDTLAKIAKKHATTYQELAKMNNIKNPNLIYAGTTLVVAVPTDATATTAAPTTPAPTAPAKVDVVASASVKESSDTAKLADGLSEKGYWIFAILSDVKMNTELNVTGTFRDKGDMADTTKNVYRKLALYAQDDKKNVTANYTLTVPKLNVASPNFRIQNGKVVGDIYVNATGFNIVNTQVEGNIYFATQSQMDSADLSKAKITGKVELKPFVDGVSSASIKESKDPVALAKGLSKEGAWIYAITNNVTATEALNVEGTFRDKGADIADATAKVYRKLALYAQDAAHVVTTNYTLTVPQINVASPNFRIQNGKVVGDIYVNATGFNIVNTQVEGNICFATQAQMDSSDLSKGKVTGKVEVKPFVDGVSSASIKESKDPAALAKGLSKDGTWIYAITTNVKVDGELNVDGTFHDKELETNKIYRKLALYAQDAAHVVTAGYTLTVPKMNVTSPNFRIQNGTVVGDIYVNADGFELTGATVEGNVYFKTEAQKASALLEKGTIKGTVGIK